MNGHQEGQQDLGMGTKTRSPDCAESWRKLTGLSRAASAMLRYGPPCSGEQIGLVAWVP